MFNELDIEIVDNEEEFREKKDNGKKRKRDGRYQQPSENQTTTVRCTSGKWEPSAS
jgi:hypothetical protein